MQSVRNSWLELAEHWSPSSCSRDRIQESRSIIVSSTAEERVKRCYRPQTYEWKAVTRAFSPYDHAELRRHHDWRQPEHHRRLNRTFRRFVSLVQKRVISASLDVSIEATFELLAERWKEETRLLSSMSKKILNTSYLRIIGLGPRALPLILRELKREPAYWFYALSSIAGEDPAAEETSFDGAVRAWLEWGAARHLL